MRSEKLVSMKLVLWPLASYVCEHFTERLANFILLVGKWVTDTVRDSLLGASL